MIHTRLVALVAATAAVALTMTSGAVASAAPRDSDITLVTYSKTVGFDTVDGNEAGIDHGDLFHREKAVSRTPGGAVIGVSYSQAEIVSYNVQDNVDVRRVQVQTRLPKGQVFAIGITELKRGETPEPGWTDTYAVIGGTGKYAGARGTKSLLLLPDRQTFKVTWRLSLL